MTPATEPEPITSIEREQVRQEEIAALRKLAEPGGTVWSRHNLAEVLPEPTPMTWDLVSRHFLAVHGGLGDMYRDLGYDPDPNLKRDGCFDLIAGRPYVNLSREPRLLFRRLPLVNSFAGLKHNPRMATCAQPQLSMEQLGLGFWLGLPILLVQLARSAFLMQACRVRFERDFYQAIVPSLLAVARAEESSQLTSDELKLRGSHWMERTLKRLGRHTLKPTVLAGVEISKLMQILARPLGPERAAAAVAELSARSTIPPEADLGFALRRVARGELSRAEFLSGFGHRGEQEMELSRPRWSEDPAGLDRFLEFQPAEAPFPVKLEDPVSRIALEAKLSGSRRARLEKHVACLRRFVGLREAAKHYFMMGYGRIRRGLLEMDRRFGLKGGIFFLTLDELSATGKSEDYHDRIAFRRRRRQTALSIETPPVIFSDDLEAVDRRIEYKVGDRLQGTPLSAGVATGPALVLTNPCVDHGSFPGYILVCPSTDPAWVPLFAGANGLVMETGSVLSHGAIVAREFGLPAVAGIAGVHRQLRTGQQLRVDGRKGEVQVLSSPNP